MKVVIKVSRLVINSRSLGRQFARAVADLIHDRHSVILIHGSDDSLEYSGCAGMSGATKGKRNPCIVNGNSYASQVTSAEAGNRMLVVLLSEARIAALGLCASDAGLIQLRRRPGDANNLMRMEAARLNPRWLEIICSHAGIPVLSNLCFCACGMHHFIDPEHMSAICAINWDADALIYLTHEEGVLAVGGDVVRWLDVEAISMLQLDRISDGMQRRLQACAMALKKGVRRVKILPVSNLASLAGFYTYSIRYGTEIVATSADRLTAEMRKEAIAGQTKT